MKRLNAIVTNVNPRKNPVTRVCCIGRENGSAGLSSNPLCSTRCASRPRNATWTRTFLDERAIFMRALGQVKKIHDARKRRRCAARERIGDRTIAHAHHHVEEREWKQAEDAHPETVVVTELLRTSSATARASPVVNQNPPRVRF